METKQNPISYKRFDAEEVYANLNDGRIVWLIAVTADGSIEMYDTVDNQFITKSEPFEPQQKELFFIVEGGHCGSMLYQGVIKECKWKLIDGQLRCRRCAKNWPVNEGCS